MAVMRDGTGRFLRRDPAERFWARVDVREEAECWQWLGYVAPTGYGMFSLSHTVPVGAHRYSYETTNGPIPAGRQIDHLCKNRRCVNPAHLEAVTPAENTYRSDAPSAHNAGKRFCPKGHPLFGDNLKLKDGGRRRACRQCAAEEGRRRRAAQGRPTRMARRRLP